MCLGHKNISVQVISWIKEKDYIKVQNPVTGRVIYLSGDKAKVFESLDTGCTTDEVYEELIQIYPETTKHRIEEIIQLFVELRLVQLGDQFEN